MLTGKKIIWDYYTRNGNLATCNHKDCNKVIKCVSGSSSGLHYHLRNKHNVNLLKRLVEDKEAVCSLESKRIVNKTRGPIDKYVIRNIDDSFPAVVARLVALDCLSFQKIHSSYDLMEMLKLRGYNNIPKSSTTIKKIILDFGLNIREQTIRELKVWKVDGGVFSLTFDEWTSQKNRRFMNVNIHANNNVFWNLGLIRIKGSMTYDKCIELLRQKLSAFKVDFESIFSITTDGASVMKKVGSEISTNHQLCLVHGIQLAVIQVLYKILPTEDASTEKTEDEDDDEEENEDIETFEIINEPSNSGMATIKHLQVAPIITKIRQVAVMFRRSPRRNDILQSHVKAEFQKELSLIVDSKTRWNSLLIMIERFYEIRNCVRKTLIDIQSEIHFSEKELNIVAQIIAALQPVKIAVEELCSRDVDLYTADITLKFMLDELAKQNNILSNELKEALIDRINQRRTILSDVSYYLHEPRYKPLNTENNYGVFHKTSKVEILKKLVDIAQKYSQEPKKSYEDDVIEMESTTLTTEQPIVELSMKEKLKLTIKNKRLTDAFRNEPKTTKGLQSLIENEMVSFRNQNIRGKYLSKALSHISTVQPTSVESERAFSAAGLIVTKFRSSLGDDSVDTICFLRAFFEKQFK